MAAKSSGIDPLQGRRRIPTQKRAKLTVESILQAALEVYEKEGFAYASTNRIAEHAGVSISSLYQYFSDKESIYLSLYARVSSAVARELNETVIAYIGHDLEEAFLGLVETFLSLYEANRVVLIDLADEIPELRTGEHCLSVSRLIADASYTYLEQQFEAKDQQNTALAFFFLQTTTYSAVKNYLIQRPEEIPREVFVEELARVLANYLHHYMG